MPETESDPRPHRKWALRVAVGAMALTLIPYLFGFSLTGARPEMAWFSWLGYNLDDSGVYLSWMRQAADGHFFQRNLFTTEPQLGHQFSLFFLLLGNLARLLHLPLILVYHGARLILGVAFLRAFWWLLELLLPGTAQAGVRRYAFLVAAFSAGFGWMPGLWQHSGIQSPIDVWQPEAITFLSLYLSPLFLASLLLMVGVLGCLIIAERTGSLKAAVYAGLCGLLLGNIHTYDVVTLCAVWGGYLLVKNLLRRRFDARTWGLTLIAGALTAVSTGYMFYLVKTEDVFAKRAAVPTLAPELLLVILGYGAVIAAALGVLRMVLPQALGREPKHGAGCGPEPPLALDSNSALLLVVWALVNVAVSYLPVSFNRKMLMGAHLPLSTLAGIALWQARWAWSRVWWLWVGLGVVLPPALLVTYLPEAAALSVVPVLILLACVGMAARSRSDGWQTKAGFAGAVVLLALTNCLFLARDAGNFLANRGQSGIQRPYLTAGEIQSLSWLREHAPEGAAVQPLPWVWAGNRQVRFVDTTVALLTPGLTGHPVHAGHWGETPDFGATMNLWVNFLKPNSPDDARRELLRRTGVRYVLFTQKHDAPGDPTPESGILALFRGTPPAYLRLIPEASNADADVYEVVGI